MPPNVAQSWTECDEDVRAFVDSVVNVFRSELGDNLVCVYLHGSLAMGSYYRPKSDVDILGVVQALERAGYRGWYVIEQDTAITDGPPPEGEGPIHQVTTSMQYLTDVVEPSLA